MWVPRLTVSRIRVHKLTLLMIGTGTKISGTDISIHSLLLSLRLLSLLLGLLIVLLIVLIWSGGILVYTAVDRARSRLRSFVVGRVVGVELVVLLKLLPVAIGRLLLIGV